MARSGRGHRAGHPPRGGRRRPDRRRRRHAGPRGDGRRRPADAALRRPARPAAADRPGAGRRRPCSTWPTRRTPSTPSRPTSSAPGTSASTSRATEITDVSGHDRHGTTINLPTRAVTGHDFTGEETDWRQRPGEYGAIHFHRDDLEDAGWEADFELTIPADLPSGIYAAWLQADDDEDYLPFTVRPPRGTQRSRIAVLMSTVTYVTYANFTDIGRDAWREGGWHGRRDGPALRRPVALPRRLRLHRRALAVRHVRHPRGRVGRVLRLDAAADPQHAPEVPLPDARCAGALPGRPLPGRLARAEGHRGRLPDRPRPPRRGRRPAPAVHGRRLELAPRVLDGRDARLAGRRTSTAAAGSCTWAATACSAS